MEQLQNEEQLSESDPYIVEEDLSEGQINTSLIVLIPKDIKSNFGRHSQVITND